MICLGQLAGLGHVGLGQLVADTPAARVQHHPYPGPFVDAHLEEVVARSQGAELLEHLGGAVAGELGGRLVGAQPPLGVAIGPVVSPPHAGRDDRLDSGQQRVQGIGQLVLGDIQLGGDHAAADVHTDSAGDYRPAGGDHRADGGTDTHVGVGHESDVPVHDGQAGGLLGLGDGGRVDVAGPGDQLVVDGGGHVTPCFVS